LGFFQYLSGKKSCLPQRKIESTDANKAATNNLQKTSPQNLMTSGSLPWEKTLTFLLLDH
jgi:hypothetical protein